jgi:hypothetical protein
MVVGRVVGLGSFMWNLKYMDPGPERYKAIEKFWKKIYEEHPPEDESLIFRSFSMNDFLLYPLTLRGHSMTFFD